jgi:benzoyl-CoA reductase subunit B
MAQGISQINRIKTTTKVGPLLNEFYQELFDGRPVCYCIGPVPHEILEATGVAGFEVENNSARMAAANEQGTCIDLAEGSGLGTEACSYAKIHIGQSLLMVSGEDAKIPERFRLPRPVMVACFSICPTMLQWARTISELFNVPLFGGDVPFFYDKANWKSNIEYVKKQVSEFITFLEKHTGKVMDWERLREVLGAVREMSIYRRLIWELGKIRPTPASFIDSATAMGPALAMRSERAVTFYKEFAEEVIQRARHGMSVISNEKYRLMWRGNFPWHKMGFISRLLAKQGAVIVSGTYGFWAYGDLSRDMIPPDGFDLNDPLLTIAAENALGGGYTQSFEWKMEKEFKQHIDEFGIDAVIIHSPFTCRPWALATFEMAQRVQKEYGIPALVLDSDHTDARYFQDAQVETRIQALLESVDANRAKKDCGRS